MAANSPNFRAHGDNNRNTSTPHTRDALNAVENLYNNVAIPHEAVTRNIQENVSADVNRALVAQGNPSVVVRNRARDQLRQMNRGGGLGRQTLDWFRRDRPTEEQRRQERFFHQGAGNAAADLRAQREVGQAGLLDAGDIRGQIDGLGPAGAEILATLRQRLGRNVADNMRDHPALLVALRILIQNVGGVNRNTFIQEALDGQAAAAAGGRPPEQMEQILTQAGQRIPQITTAANAVRTGARHGLNHEIHAQQAIVNRVNVTVPAGVVPAVPPMQAAENLVVTRQGELDTAQTNLAAGTGTPAAVAAATAQLSRATADRDRLRTELTNAQQRIHHLEELGFSFRDHAQDLLSDITRFYGGTLPTTPVELQHAVEELEHLRDHLVYDPAAHQFADMDAALAIVNGGELQDAWDHIQHHAHDEIGRARNAQTAQVTHETITPEMFLYRIYYRHITQVPGNGGAPGTPAMNAEQQRNLAPRAAMAVRFMLSEAKDATTLEALRVRSEIVARGRVNRRDRVRFLPDLNNILATFRYLGINDARPFAKLKLDKQMERSELRAAMQHAGMDVTNDVPHLIAHLQGVLRGHDNQVLREADVPLLTGMVRNLNILRDEEKFRSVMAAPGTFDEKLAKLLANDDSLETARSGVNDALLFDAITNKKFVKEQEKHIIEDVKNRVRNGELTIKDAMKELKDNGIDAGRGMWAKLLAIRTGQNVKNTWKNAKGRGPFAWAGRKVKSGWASAKKITKAPKWFMGTFLGKALNYSLNPKTMGKNYSPLPPFLKGGHGHGHGGGDHGGGDHGGGGAHH